MRITLTRFRCYSGSFSRDFATGKLTLIDGVSGVGKTTILEAIFWALFGGKSHIYPIGSTPSATKPTSVTLELNPDFIIKRLTPPAQIEVTVGTTTLIGVQAQAYIESHFGTRDFFVTSAYIQQGGRCLLMVGSDSVKTQLLQELTFGSQTTDVAETPELYLQRIQQELETMKTYITSVTSQYNLLQSHWQQAMTQHATAYTAWLQQYTSIDRLPELEAQLGAVHAKLPQEQAKLQALTKVATQVALLTDQLQAIPKLSEPSPVDHTVELADLTRRIAAVQAANAHRREISDLQQHLQNFDLQLVENANIPELEMKIVAAQAVERQYMQLNVPIDRLAVTIADVKAEIAAIAAQAVKYAAWEAAMAAAEVEYTTMVATEAARVAAINVERQAIYEQHRAEYEAAHQTRAQLLATHQVQQANYNHWLQRMAEYAEQRTRREQLEQKREELQLVPQPNGTIDALEAELRRLQLASQQLYCPHCQGSVLLTSSPESSQTLVPGVLDYTASQDLAAKQVVVSDQLRAWQHYQQAQAQLDTIERRLTDLGTKLPVPSPRPEPLPLLLPNLTFPTLQLETPQPLSRHAPPSVAPPPDLKPVTDRLTQLAALPAVTETSQALERQLAVIRRLQAQLPLYHRLQTLTAMSVSDEQLDVLLQRKLHLETAVQAHVRQVAEYQAMTQHRDRLQAQMAHIDYQPEALTALQTTLTDLESEARTLDHAWKMGQIVKQLQHQTTELQTCQATLLQATDYEGKLLKLRGIIQELAAQAVEETVSAINYTCNLILKEIFEDDIQVLLATHKDLKTRDITRVQVNLQVTYRGQVYDAVNRLSGGEQDRVSFALTLAMAKVAASPLLMLDECMAALNEDLRERCLEVMETVIPGKTILHVCHSAVKGQHMEVMELCCS
jgi:DNA repair exonuclease SbcCD ATPase subunit